MRATGNRKSAAGRDRTQPARHHVHATKSTSGNQSCRETSRIHPALTRANSRATTSPCAAVPRSAESVEGSARSAPERAGEVALCQHGLPHVRHAFDQERHRERCSSTPWPNTSARIERGAGRHARSCGAPDPAERRASVGGYSGSQRAPLRRLADNVLHDSESLASIRCSTMPASISRFS